jgi:glycosyltransferase involved in cell wall biosynthesis
MPIAIAVCIITYRRPLGLERLLTSLARQTGPSGTEIAIVVVDNDPERSAAAAVESALASGLAIDYDHEPTPGIPRARNRSVERALARGVTRLCFVDDDEIVDPEWIASLLSHAATTDAAVVTGPVLSVLPPEVPKWLVHSRLFSRRRFPTGTRVDRAATNNVMVHRRVFDTLPSWFDESAPLSGGTDSDFFERVHRAGFAIEWCDQAVVREEVPLERCNLRWIGRRNLRGGLGFSRRARRYDGPVAVVRNFAVGLLRVGWAGLLSVSTLGLVPSLRLRIVENAGLGAGLALGCFDVEIDEYSRG